MTFSKDLNLSCLEKENMPNVTDSPLIDSLQKSDYLLMVAESKFLISFGKRVRELREGKGLSQEDFAGECGLDRTYISGIERGRRNIGIKNAKVLATTLGISLSELFKGL